MEYKIIRRSEINNFKRVYIWGAGAMGNRTQKYYGRRCSNFIDNDKTTWNKTMHGVEVECPERVMSNLRPGIYVRSKKTPQLMDFVSLPWGLDVYDIQVIK